MKETRLEQLKKDIRNYFFTIYRYEHISSQETEMCLKSYCDYLFLKNNINTDNLRIVIRKVKRDQLDPSETAKMSVDGNLFEIFLCKDSFSIKEISKIETILCLWVSLGHEAQHVMQYLKAYKMMDKYDKHILKIINLANEHDKKYSSRKNKKLVNKLTNLYCANVTISSVELNAVFRSYENLKLLLKDLIETESNASFKNFLSLLLIQLDYVEKADSRNNKIAKKEAKKNVSSIQTEYNLNSKEIYVF